MTDFGLGKIPYGGDWNPEQWSRDVWDEDVRLFQLAGIDLLTVNVFAWTLDQPGDDTYDFRHLDEVMDLLAEHGMKACLGTGTAALPAWMATKYPDVLRVDFQGRAHRYGDRHNACPSSPTYRRFAPALAGELARRYATHPALALWHVSNEFGGACYCPRCEARFREWLRARYGHLDALNHAWNTRFWSQTVSDWDEIVVPNALSVQWGERNTAVQGLTLDFQRFTSGNLLDAYRLEEQAIRAVLPQATVTTNLMGTYRGLDYREWAPHLDVVGWDSYPAPGDPPAVTAMKHALMRGLKAGAPFMLMEQTPSQTNWQPYNALKRPGVMRLQSWQAVAHGADAVMFFQMRRSVGAGEKFHGAVIEHHGRSDTRVFQEVAVLGAELQALGGTLLGSRVQAQAALWFDWNSWWAAENSMGPSVALSYLDELNSVYAAFHAQGYAVDLVGPGDDLSSYRLLAAPLLYLLDQAVPEALDAFVEGGGLLLTTIMSGVADRSDRVFPGGPPGPLRELLGLWVEEVDALPPDAGNRIVLSGPLGTLTGSFPCRLLFEQLRVEGAEVLATYGEDFYAGRPVLTRHRRGQGQAWKLGTCAGPEFLQGLVAHLCAEASVPPLLPGLPAGVEVTRREGEGEGDRFLFLLNHTAHPAEVQLDAFSGTDLLSGTVQEGTVTLEPYAVRVIREGGGHP